MAKKIERTNFRAVTDIPIGFGPISEKEMERDGQQIVEQIKRHVDVESVYLKWDIKITCGLCGFPWEINDTEDDPDWPLGIPVCCTKAQEEWERQTKKED